MWGLLFLWVTKGSRLACTSVRLYAKCYEIGQFHNKTMTQRDDTYDQYLRNRRGKRLPVPSGEISSFYQSQRKRRVRVEITGPTKITCKYCGTLFYHSLMVEAAILNTIPMPVSKKRTGNEEVSVMGETRGRLCIRKYWCL